jgi:hypothetical protein
MSFGLYLRLVARMLGLPRVVTDNLNIHREKSFYEAFSEDEAKQILEKIEFHYTPKHASWLKIVQ